MNGETDLWTLVTVLALAGVTVLARCFFFISSKSWNLPHWAQRGLQYAPIAALSAVVLPEIVMTSGQLVGTWANARLFGAVAGVLAYYWRRDVLITITVGMGVFLPLHLMLGW